MHMFSKLHYGLAIILSFIGVKMILAPWIHISSLTSLILIATVLIISILWSIYTYRSQK